MRSFFKVLLCTFAFVRLYGLGDEGGGGGRLTRAQLARAGGGGQRGVAARMRFDLQRLGVARNLLTRGRNR